MSSYYKKANPHLELYKKAAEELGISFTEEIKNKVVAFEKDNKKWFITNAITPLNTATASNISGSKHICSTVLKNHGLPVPNFEVFTEINDAQEYFRKKHGTKLVVKPSVGIGGQGVTICPTNIEEFTEAFNTAKSFFKKIVVEEFITGRHYRVLVLDDEVIAVAARLPASVVGNGQDSLIVLVDSENVLREKKVEVSQIPVNNEFMACIKEQGLTMQSIIPDKKTIFVHRNTNLSTGGTTEDVTDLIHPDNCKLALDACKIIGLKLAGVDLIIPDISKSHNQSKAFINEINPAPGLRIHHYRTNGKSRNIANKILAKIYEITQ